MNAESMMLNHKLCIYVDPATLNLRINNKKKCIDILLFIAHGDPLKNDNSFNV